jgi:ketosteroid isomerase-like protein
MRTLSHGCRHSLAPLFVLAASDVASTEETKAMLPNGSKEAIARQHVALNEFVRGNVAPWNDICSQADDVTIVGGWGGFERGWLAEVGKRYAWAATRFTGAEGEVQVENVALIATPELAYSVDIERSRVKLRGSTDFVPMTLRVTTVYRPENGQWKMVHRHADPLMTVQAPASVLQK